MPLTPVRMLVNLRRCAAVERRTIDIGDHLPIGEEVQRLAVGRPLRADVLGLGKTARLADRAGSHVHHREAQAAGFE